MLGYETGLALDEAKHHPDADRRASAQRWCTLITPILKAACTEQGFKGASDCLQVFGGHGYVREWGIEQHVRDARIAMIYEGTNEIQAIDLLMRKVLGDGGTGLFALLDELSAPLRPANTQESRVLKLFEQLRSITQAALAVQGRANGAVSLNWVAGDYLRLAALALLAWAWTRIDQAVQAAPDADALRWHAPGQALQHWVLPEFDMRAHMIHSHFKTHE